jgi:hypothetical protein
MVTTESYASNVDRGRPGRPLLHATAVELRSGRPVPIELRRAVRGLADALRREMQP